jgi:hypothetical protein
VAGALRFELLSEGRISAARQRPHGAQDRDRARGKANHYRGKKRKTR